MMSVTSVFDFDMADLPAAADALSGCAPSAMPFLSQFTDVMLSFQQPRVSLDALSGLTELLSRGRAQPLAQPVASLSEMFLGESASSAVAVGAPIVLANAEEGCENSCSSAPTSEESLPVRGPPPERSAQELPVANDRICRDRERNRVERRRRRNREASARCYQNRKLRREAFERDFAEAKKRKEVLYARELQLRKENARLKKEVVLRNLTIPSHLLSTRHRSAE